MATSCWTRRATSSTSVGGAGQGCPLTSSTAVWGAGLFTSSTLGAGLSPYVIHIGGRGGAVPLRHPQHWGGRALYVITLGAGLSSPTPACS